MPAVMMMMTQSMLGKWHDIVSLKTNNRVLFGIFAEAVEPSQIYTSYTAHTTCTVVLLRFYPHMCGQSGHSALSGVFTVLMPFELD